MQENDITKEEYAPWLEEMLRDLQGFKPKRIAVAAIDAEGKIATSYFKCIPSFMDAICGTIQQDALFMRIEANPEWLRSVLKGDEEEEPA